MTRKQKLDTAGLAIITAVMVLFLSAVAGAYFVDRAHGISPHQSMEAWGL